MAATATENPRRGRPLRLFFALWPGQDTAAALWQLAQALRKTCGGRATSRDNLHLTQAFLGAVEPQRADRLLQLGASVAAGAAAFDLSLDRIGCCRRQHLVWAGSGVMPGALGLLAARLGAALQGGGFAIEHRAFKPHVTLLRDAGAVPAPAAAGLYAWPVRELLLAGSESGPRGPRYRTIGRWPLAARL
ncbi:MAG: RNA 2',3'-cyclic phosphodiesterase [Betaproteobacteria bacterium]|nr:RNA 2',3'-cyclic phosphodiesterase [Betaproteobacteria bacterium]